MNISNILPFLHFDFIDLIDILLVAVLLFSIYRLIKGTVAFNILIGIIAIFIIYKVVSLLKLELLGMALSKFISIGVLIIVIVFQQELRQLLFILGTPRLNRVTFAAMIRMKFKPENKYNKEINELINAVQSMAKQKCGALIIITKKNDLKTFVRSGELIDAHISSKLIESIFYKNNPLHDGAIIITKDKIKAAKCVLPLTEREGFPAQLGTRHRAATGITELTDAYCILISEQTGEIAYTENGIIPVSIDLNDLKLRVTNILNN